MCTVSKDLQSPTLRTHTQSTVNADYTVQRSASVVDAAHDILQGKEDVGGREG